jgi:hypothetical protein
MFQSLKCLLKGHMYVDSRSQPGTEVCVRCRHRRPFEGLERMQAGEDAAPEGGNEPPAARSLQSWPIPEMARDGRQQTS